MGKLSVIARDARGIARVCGPWVAAAWLGRVIAHFDACRRAGSLAPVDRAMGAGPFAARSGGSSARLQGDGVFGGVREIWVRDVYLDGGFLEIGPEANVVDLGANRGNFTLLALGHGPGVRCVSVEAVHRSVEWLRRALELNGWSERAQVVQAFVGGRTGTQEIVLADGQAAGVGFIDENELIRRTGLERIDLLKCDIEGSEFELLTRDSRLLAMARQVAVEIHRDCGDEAAILDPLRERGFELRTTVDAPEAVTVLARLRSGH